MSEEFYTRPVLFVQDLTASIDYYCEQLGFIKMWSAPEGNPIIAQVGRNGLEIILDAQSVIPKASIPSVLSLSLHQPKQLGALYHDFKRRGAKVTTSPFEVIWEENLYQFDVEDIDGNILVFWGEEPGSL